MKHLIKKYQFFVGMFFFPYIFLVLLLIVPTKYEAITLGSYYEVINEDEVSSSFYALYVKSWYMTTPFQKIYINHHPMIDYYEISNLSIGDQINQGNISKQSSLEQSFLTSHYFASIHDISLMPSYKLEAIVMYDAYESLKIGNMIVQIDDVKLDTLSYYEFMIYLKSKAETNDKVKIQTNTEYSSLVDAKSLYTTRFYPKYSIASASTLKNSNTGGPSAGLIYTIKQYVDLMSMDLGNLKIAATGTINFYDEDHISIGAIGGLKQKIYGLKDANIDVLFLPKYHDTKEINRLLDTYLKQTNVYFVERFEEVVEVLHGLI